MDDDFENEISLSCIRKLAVAESRKQQEKCDQKKRYLVEPMLIRDLLAVDTSNNDFVSAFNGSHQFKRCFIYGRIVGCKCSSKLFKTYNIDDGTARINVRILNMDQETQDLRNMKRKIRAVKKLQVKESLRSLLYVSERLMDVFHLMLGTRILVLGQPKVVRGELLLGCESLFVDDGIDRKLEVAFKDTLIDCYMRHKKHTEP